MASLVSTTVNGDLKVTGSSNLFFEGSASSNTFEPGTRIYGGAITLTGGAYTSVFEYTVPGGLAGNFRFFVKGTTGGVVVPTQVDVVLNHSKDITIKSQTGNYTPLHVKVLTNNNEDCLVQIKADTSGSVDVTVYIDVIAFGDGSVSFSSFGSYTGTSLEHKCNFGFSFSTIDNTNESKFVMDGGNTDGGRLGIGTNSPGQPLDVLGKVSINTDGTLNWGAAKDYGRLTWSTTNSRAIVRGESGKNLSLGANGAQDYVFIKTDGNVGIGTTAPGSKLQVTGGDISFGTRLDSATRYIGKGQSAGGSFGGNSNWIGFASDAADDWITFGVHESGVGGGEAVRINYNKKVGIGTNNPSSTLHVNSEISVGADDNNRAMFGYTPSRFYLGTRQGGTNYLNTVSVTSGSVGIGTVTPSSLLHVFSASSSQTFSTGADELLVEGSDHAGLSILAPAAKRAQLYFNTDAFLRWVDNDALLSIDTSASASKIAIAPGGAKVGIGTNDPKQLFFVQPASGVNFGISNSGTALRLNALNDAANANVRMEFTGSDFGFLTGSVGIGTTNPTQKLEVSGNIIVNNQILTPSGSNLALNPNTGLVTVGGSLTVTGTVTATTFSGTLSGTADKSNMVTGSAFATTGSPGSVLEYQQAASITDTKLAPTADWYNTIRMGHGNPYSYYSNTIAMQMTGTGAGQIRTQRIANNVAQGWRTVWDSVNDGAGSGLDADLLDGLQATSFLRSDADDTTTGNLKIGSAGSAYSGTNVVSLTINGVYPSFALGNTSNRFILTSYSTYTNYETVSSADHVFSGGSVGIGTNDPDSLLMVYKSGADSIIHVRGASSGADARVRINGYNSSELYIDRNGLGRFAFRRTTGTDDLSLLKLNNDYSDNSTIMFWDYSSGSVGIGTTNPGTTLTVKGVLSITGDGSNAVTFTETGAGLMTIATADDFVVDAGGDIRLDANGGDIRLNDNGVSIGRLGLENGDLNLASEQQDYDVRIKGNDGGSVITALHFDMSAGGAATFSSSVTASSFSGTGSSLTSLNGTNISSGLINVARLGSGATSSKFLRGDNTWQTVTSGGGSVTSVAVTVGTGLAVSGSPITSSGTIDIDLDLSEFTDMTSDITTSDEVILLDSGAERRKAFGELKLSKFNNDSGWTNNTGNIGTITVGTGLDGGGSSSSVSINLDLSELADMTQSWTSDDEFIVLDSGTQKRKRSGEIFGSNAFNSTTIPTNNNQLTNGAGYTTNTGTTTASNTQTFTNKSGNISQWTNNSGYTTNTGNIGTIVAGTTLSGGGSTDSVTINHGSHTGEVTGSGALTIANNVVDEANLKVSNSPTNGYVLTARSGNTGGMTWEAVSGGGSGTVTSVATGTGLTGGPITTSGTLSVTGSVCMAFFKNSPSGSYISPSSNSITFSEGTGVTLGFSGSTITFSAGTSSDYRLKKNISTFNSEAWTKVKSVNLRKFDFDEDSYKTAVASPDREMTEEPKNYTDNIGFIAHELAEAGIKGAVIGDKDAVDEDGNFIYQKVNYIALVPVLWGALKEAISKIETLESKVQALENK